MKLKELKLNENAIAVFGDWQLDELTVSYISKIGVDRYYEFVSDVVLPIGKKKLYKLNSSHFYIVGDFVTKQEETKFETIFEIDLKPTSIPKHSNQYMNVDGVKVPDKYKCRMIALSMYVHFVKQLGFKLLGDEYQYFGARRLWSKLSKLVDVQVDIVDITTGDYLEKNVVLHHGTDDWDFDERVWSYDVDKKDRRLILTDIKM